MRLIVQRGRGRFDLLNSADQVRALPNVREAASLAYVVSSPRHGSILVDTTTGDPAHFSSIGKSLADYGIHCPDATVAGSSEEAQDRSRKTEN